jgi:hypothetical protein
MSAPKRPNRHYPLVRTLEQHLDLAVETAEAMPKGDKKRVKWERRAEMIRELLREVKD